MKSNKKFKFIKIILTFAVLAFGTITYLQRGAKIDISYSSEFAIGAPIKININTYDHYKPHSPETLKVNVYNKYNKDESITTTIKPYEEGKYQLVLTPNFAGEYRVNVQYTDGSTVKSLEDSFKVK